VKNRGKTLPGCEWTWCPAAKAARAEKGRISSSCACAKDTILKSKVTREKGSKTAVGNTN